MSSKAVSLAVCILALAAASGLPGCGYTFTAKAPIELPNAISTLYLARVDNPSTETSLDPSLRNALRDEFTRSGNITWVDEDVAEGRLELTIHNFQSSTKLEDPQETTVRSEMILRIELMLFSAASHEQLAGSGRVTARESFDPSDNMDEQEARDQVVKLAVELAVQRLNQHF